MIKDYFQSWQYTKSLGGKVKDNYGLKPVNDKPLRTSFTVVAAITAAVSLPYGFSVVGICNYQILFWICTIQYLGGFV